MKIVKLTIHNFLKLKDVEMNPSHTNVIVGKNKQGKTSVLKAIRAAFSGEADQSSIRIGGDKAEILIETEDLNVRRTITEKGNYLDVSNKEGFKVPSPQKYLDGILGTFSFNPVEFFELKPVDRKKYLLNAIKMQITPELLATFTGEKLAGIDFEKHALEVVEDVRKFYYDKRTVVNSEVSKKQKTIAELSAQIPEGFDPKSVSTEKVDQLRKAITDNEVAKKEVENKLTQVKQLAIRVEKLKEELGLAIEEHDRFARLLQEEQKKVVDTSALEKELTELEGKRDIVHTFNQVEAARLELNTSMAEQERLDTVVKKLTKEVPDALIKEAKLPVEGLTIDGNDILINDVNLDNLSSSEQLKFGLEICKKLNDQFKVICIDGIELLDAETFEWFLKEIEGDDYQYFVTRVDGNVANKIVIEEGEIKNGQATE